MAKKKNIDFRIEFEPDLPEIYIDREACRKVIYNLLSNALKFTKEGGEINLRVCKTSVKRDAKFKNYYAILSGSKPLEEFVEINVEDTGIGIAENSIKSIFDGFYQNGTAEKNTPAYIKNQGSGLGLAITKQIVLLHKGDLIVHSSLEAGTRFTIHLPLGKSHLLPNQIIDSANENSNDGFVNDFFTLENRENDKLVDLEKYESVKPLILIVDDNTDLRTYLKNTLEDQYSIIEASNGLEGTEKAKELNPNLIISDVVMPEMSGKELCFHLKNDVLTSHIPIILLTMQASQENMYEGYQVGADLYVAKPFESGLLKIQIQNLLDNRAKTINKFKNSTDHDISDLAISNIDKDILGKITQVVKDHIPDHEFNVDILCKEVGLGRKTLQNKLKLITGFAPAEFINSIRLNQALELLKNTQLTAAEIAFRTGFSSPSYFTHCFKEKFNKTPKEFSKGLIISKEDT